MDWHPMGAKGIPRTSIFWELGVCDKEGSSESEQDHRGIAFGDYLKLAL